jgi:hypothetical protein
MVTTRIDVGTMPVSALTVLTAHPVMGGETCHYTHLIMHCLPSITLEGGYDKARLPQSRGFDLIRPTLTLPRPGLDAPHSSTEREGRHGTALRVISPSRPLRRHGVRGWPAIPMARRHSHSYRDRQNVTSGLPGVLASSYPIKGQAGALQRTEKTANNRPHTSPKPSAKHSKAPHTEINISSNHLCTLFSSL